jgi:hypothetical protein
MTTSSGRRTSGHGGLRRVLDSRTVAVTAAAAVLVTAGATGAVAAGMVTSATIKNGSVRGVDLASGAVGSAKIANGSVQVEDLQGNSVGSRQLRSDSVGTAQIRDNAISRDELSDGVLGQLNRAGSSVGSDWGIVDRNVIGAGDAYLRTGPSSNSFGTGPVSPPLGEGSLGLRTASANDKAAFGNQIRFDGDLVSGLTTVAFSVFTTQENNARGNNMPSIVFEIDPNLAAAPGVEFASMVYTPANSRPDRWTSIDATDNTQGRVWGLTGQAGTTTGCALSGTRCTWDEIHERLEDGDGNPARIYTVQVTKGRDHAFSGAVDALRIRGLVFDFEPLGVLVR